MELKQRIDTKVVFIIAYVVLFIVYIVIGLQPAEAVNYEITSKLNIPSIGLESDVTKLSYSGVKLDTPDTIVGSYAASDNKTFLIGHSSTVFGDLDDVKIGDYIEYDSVTYKIVKARLAVKEVIDMDEILAPADIDTIVIMTCAGDDLGNGDASHRLIITAEAQ